MSRPILGFNPRKTTKIAKGVVYLSPPFILIRSRHAQPTGQFQEKREPAFRPELR